MKKQTNSKRQYLGFWFEIESSTESYQWSLWDFDECRIAGIAGTEKDAIGQCISRIDRMIAWSAIEDVLADFYNDGLLSYDEYYDLVDF